MPGVVLKLNRSFWLLLIIGVVLRCVALNQPLIDAHLIRQCQTASVTKGLINETGFHLSSRIPWLGNLSARYVLELPIYNYLVVGVYKLIGHVDLSGKLTSILLWAACFTLVQFIWGRLFDSRAAFWANLLFVISPLSLFFGQAFMPETTVQFFALGFVLQVIRYNEGPTVLRWICVAGLGLAALLLKLPETAHLYFIVGFLTWSREGWKGLVRPRYLLAAAVTVVAIRAWSSYMDSVNAAYLPEWTSRGNMHQFAGSLGDRFRLQPWLMISFYIGALLVPGPALVAAGYGLYIFVRRQPTRLLGSWLVALAIYYLVWLGNAGPAGQSYYNLPALVPLCALFGIGMQEIFEKEWVRLWRRTTTIAAVLLVTASAVPFWAYLFNQDRQILNAALWAKANTQPDDVVLFGLNHRVDMIGYRNNPVPGYYSERPTFIWTGTLPSAVAQEARTRARYVVVTLPQPASRSVRDMLNRFRGVWTRQSEPMDWLEENRFQLITTEKNFVAYRRIDPQ